MRFAKTVIAIVIVSIQNAIFIASKRSLITGKKQLDLLPEFRAEKSTKSLGCWE